jgi:hypothetical protein
MGIRPAFFGDDAQSLMIPKLNGRRQPDVALKHAVELCGGRRTRLPDIAAAISELRNFPAFAAPGRRVDQQDSLGGRHQGPAGSRLQPVKRTTRLADKFLSRLKSGRPRPKRPRDSRTVPLTADRQLLTLS